MAVHLQRRLGGYLLWWRWAAGSFLFIVFFFLKGNHILAKTEINKFPLIVVYRSKLLHPSQTLCQWGHVYEHGPGQLHLRVPTGLYWCWLWARGPWVWQQALLQRRPLPGESGNLFLSFPTTQAFLFLFSPQSICYSRRMLLIVKSEHDPVHRLCTVNRRQAKENGVR